MSCGEDFMPPTAVPVAEEPPATATMEVPPPPAAEEPPAPAIKEPPAPEPPPTPEERAVCSSGREAATTGLSARGLLPQRLASDLETYPGVYDTWPILRKTQKELPAIHHVRRLAKMYRRSNA